MENQNYVVRANRAGVFFGEIEGTPEDALKNGSVIMHNARKLWYWDGACSIEQLAVDGTKYPKNCKFTVSVATIGIADPIQIIPCTDAASKSIKGVLAWKK